jgi:prevent-host-death family protein
MKNPSWSVQDAKDQFSKVVEAASRTPQTVTKHGKPAVVVVAAEEYERLRALQRLKAPGLGELLLAMPQGGDDFEFERLNAAPRKTKF